MPLQIVEDIPTAMSNHDAIQEDLQAWVAGTLVSKTSRLQKAGVIFSNPGMVAPLFNLAFSPEKLMSYKALLILEQVAVKKPEYLLESYHAFLDQLDTITEQRAIRPLAKITELMLLQCFKKKDPLFLEWFREEDLEKLTSQCFGWLLGPNKAAQAFAMSSLYLLGIRFPWIHTELKALIENRYAGESPAFRARARHIFPRLSDS
ncbi:hypothetical protein [Zeaxanthinibacter enoshimensis]|uniref:hypothetical protein n=1 Tax=Zeaxanthinibacter enoshimensis TaxID=392009 RepID=UPI00356B542A